MSLPSYPTEDRLTPEKEIASNWAPLLTPDHVAGPATNPIPGLEVVLLRNLFTADECAALIQASEDAGYGYTNYPKKYRGNLRLLTKDIALTAALWARVRPFIPDTVTLGKTTWRACGLNELYRLAKYYPSDVFQEHTDANFERNSKEISMFTVNVYLNQDFAKGHTRFFREPTAHDTTREQLLATSGGRMLYSTKPEAGAALIFRQPPGKYYLHDGEIVEEGIKYLLRTDVMYRLVEDK